MLCSRTKRKKCAVWDTLELSFRQTIEPASESCEHHPHQVLIIQEAPILSLTGQTAREQPLFAYHMHGSRENRIYERFVVKKEEITGLQLLGSTVRSAKEIEFLCNVYLAETPVARNLKSCYVWHTASMSFLVGLQGQNMIYTGFIHSYSAKSAFSHFLGYQ